MAEKAKSGPAWVYMVRCSGGSLYTGWTDDLEKRLAAHKSGKGAKYTRGFGAEGFAYTEQLPDKSAALKREAALKKLSKAKKEALCTAWAAAQHIHLRPVTVQDTPALRDLYGWYVQNSTATLQWQTPTVTEYEKWVRATLRKCPFICAEDEEGRILGFACAHPYHPRESFDWSAETTIYLAPDARQQGLGAPLYHGLLALLYEQGYYTAYAVLADPNPASEAFHAKLGFTCAARVPDCAFKFGAWCGISTWALPLRPRQGTPEPLKKKAPAARARRILAGAGGGASWQQLIGREG